MEKEVVRKKVGNAKVLSLKKFSSKSDKFSLRQNFEAKLENYFFQGVVLLLVSFL
jgi:hypothetical protein